MTTLLERLQASVAAAEEAKGHEPAPADAEAQAALQARQTAAVMAGLDFIAWAEEGAERISKLWDAAEDADSWQLVELLRLLTTPAGLNNALGMLVRHLEGVLGERHGKGPLIDADDVPLAVVNRTAASTKWKVDEAWPAIREAVDVADRELVDPTTGELEDDVAKALRVVRQLAGVSYLRVEACERYGLDPDDYRTKGNYRWTVQLP